MNEKDGARAVLGDLELLAMNDSVCVVNRR